MEQIRILALDTSSRSSSAALLVDDEVIGQTALTPQNQTARELAPAVAALLKKAGWKPAELKLIAVAQGPGSFTGLRIGVTLAKTLAYATGADVFGIDTLEAIAAQVLGGDARNPQQGEVEAVLDAYRGQVFAARFRRTDGRGPARIAATRTVDVEPWLQSLVPGLLVAGPVLEKLKGRLPAGVDACDQAHWQPQAATVGRLAAGYYRSGLRCDLWKLAPLYYRPSAAEEKAGS